MIKKIMEKIRKNLINSLFLLLVFSMAIFILKPKEDNHLGIKVNFFEASRLYGTSFENDFTIF